MEKVIIKYPQSNLIRSCKNACEHISLINSVNGIIKYGLKAYVVDKDYAFQCLNGEIEQTHDIVQNITEIYDFPLNYEELSFE